MVQEYYVQFLDTLEYGTIKTDSELEAGKVYKLNNGRSAYVVDFDEVNNDNLTENFEIYGTLNQDLFDGDKLKEEVKERLIEIADSLVSDMRENEIPVNVLDYWLVGSNASYNYNPESDIDVHIIVDSVEECNKHLLSILYNYVKSDFNSKYDITVKGHKVELYLEDIITSSITNGIYSLNQDKWVKEPERLEPKKFEVEKTELYKNWKERYNNLEDADIEQYINDLYLLRKESLIKGGEFGEGNLVFKQLRNEGILQELKDRLHKNKSAELTLENLQEDTGDLKEFEAIYHNGALSSQGKRKE